MSLLYLIFLSHLHIIANKQEEEEEEKTNSNAREDKLLKDKTLAELSFFQRIEQKVHLAFEFKCSPFDG